MINRDTAELPEGLSSKFEVVGKSGRPGESTWLLVDTVTNQKYRLTPKTIEGWAIRCRKESIGPSIIVAMQGPSMVAMHLPTGEFYRTGAPPDRIR